MDRIEKYRQILQDTINRHACYAPANGQIRTYALHDTERDEFLVLDIGWNEKGHRVHDVVLHFRLEKNKVCVERDATDAEVVRELIHAGIVPADIVITANQPVPQPLNELAFA